MLPSPARVNPWIVAAAVLAALTVLGAQLLRPPVLGLADNGDYQRVMAWAGLDHSTDVHDERYFSFLRTTYRILPLGSTRGGYISSEALLALAARFAATAFGAGAVLDLRVLAAIHIALYALAFGLMLRAARGLEPAAQLLAAVLLVFLLHRRRLHRPVQLLLQPDGFAALPDADRRARRRSGRPRRAVRGAPRPLLCLRRRLRDVETAGSDPGPAPRAPRRPARGRGPSRRLKKPAVWLAVALCAFSIWYGRQTPMALREAALYQVVFYEVLAHSPDPAADAAALGLDPAWLRYSGTDAFQPDSPLNDPAFRVRFLAKRRVPEGGRVLPRSSGPGGRAHPADLEKDLVAPAQLRQPRAFGGAPRSDADRPRRGVERFPAANVRCVPDRGARSSLRR